MRNSTFMFTSWLMLSAVTLQSEAVFAADAAANIRADVANGQVIFNEGKGDASACVGCHGEKGLGMDAMGAPRLANIGQVYIVKQLANFANDLYVPSGMGAVMNGVGKALSDQDRRDVAAYLDSLEYEMESSDLKALATDGIKIGKPEQGKILVTKGIKGRVPACQDCHGFNGRAPHIPALNQQKFTYLVNQLNNYRDGTRASDPKVNKIGIMQGIAKKLSDENIADIAAFLSTAPRITP